MTKRNLTEAQLAEIAGSIARSNGDRREVIAQWCRLYGCSAQKVYSYARAGGWDSGRKTRSDAGSKKSAACPASVGKAAMIKFRSTTNKYDSPMSAEDAIDVAGVAALGVKPHHVNAWLRENQLDRRSVKVPPPHITIRTFRPNELHEFDTSPCAWQLKKKDRLAWNPRYRQDIGKPTTARPIIRFVLVDHFSGALVFQYQCAHESFISSASFLHYAWSEKMRPDKWPFCGTPEVLYLDQGPTFKSAHTKELCKNLGVELLAKQPSGTLSKGGKRGSARSLGAVERAHPIIEKKFESRIRFQKPETLEELNEQAYLWCIEFNGLRKHSRHGMTRSMLWSTIRADELRIPPEDYNAFMSLAERPKHCHIYGDLTIRFKGQRYEVIGIPVDLRDTRAKVMHSPYSFPNVRVLGRDGAYYEARPLAQAPGIEGGYYENAVPFGEYRAFKDTTTEQSQKAAEKHDIGKVEAFPDFAARIGNLRYLARKGEPIQTEQAPTRLSFYAALTEIREQIGRPLKTEETAALQRKYGDWMTAAQIEDAIETLTAKTQRTQREEHEGGA